MSVLRALLILLLAASAMLGQVKLRSSQVVDFVRNSARKFPDKQVADYLKKKKGGK